MKTFYVICVNNYQKKRYRKTALEENKITKFTRNVKSPK